MSLKSDKLVFNYVINFRRVTHFWHVSEKLPSAEKCEIDKNKKKTKKQKKILKTRQETSNCHKILESYVQPGVLFR